MVAQEGQSPFVPRSHDLTRSARLSENFISTHTVKLAETRRPLTTLHFAELTSAFRVGAMF